MATRGGIGGTITTRAMWNLVDKLFANVVVDYMMNMIASEFNRRNGSTCNVNQLKKRFSSLKGIYKSVTWLLALSGFGWDESSKLVVAEPPVWDNHLQIRGITVRSPKKLRGFGVVIPLSKDADQSHHFRPCVRIPTLQTGGLVRKVQPSFWDIYVFFYKLWPT
ncbi:uncharacterized protein LOC131256475 isoform X2 [Magnolia sinica]|uniref:uncharacterized protein LOC131256475 isoform X2 n=1 Tax=Magnolia sinica TaxID=86752 RepID=UPI002658A90D|nr:uncharacterized protein LOC131256475 isoform X2 [Magnolia sinica]